ncbi:MAG: aldo/keto reductase [Steroidobacteraceae bacterium]
MSSEVRSRLSRREALGAGLAAGAALLLRGPGAAAADATLHQPLITKPIPKTGERLPAIGLGTDKFRAGEDDAIQAEIGRMQQMGGTVIDTSADYGDSEQLIGEALTNLGIRDRMFVATKLVGDGGRPSFERSLMRLHTLHVDLLQVHNLDGVDSLMPVMQRWKHDRQIRYTGITTSEVEQHADLIGYMQRYARQLDFIQVDYSIANRAAAMRVLPLARQLQLAVLINVPFGYGGTLREAQRRRLPPWAAEIGVSSWAQFLLKYVISHPAVTCAIPGSTTVAHLEDNQGAARGRLPDAAMRRRMEQFWDAA